MSLEFGRIWYGHATYRAYFWHVNDVAMYGENEQVNKIIPGRPPQSKCTIPPKWKRRQVLDEVRIIHIRIIRICSTSMHHLYLNMQQNIYRHKLLSPSFSRLSTFEPLFFY